MIPVPSVFSSILPANQHERRQETNPSGHFPLSKEEEFMEEERIIQHMKMEMLNTFTSQSLSVSLSVSPLPPPPLCHLSKHTSTKGALDLAEGVHSVQRAGASSSTTLLCGFRQVTSLF